MQTATQESIDLDLITVPRGRRPLDQDAVARLAKSIEAIGLRTPITVLSVNDGERLDLVAGNHRLAAVKSLGWSSVPCFIIEGDKIEAELWEIAENLHRADLTKEQRDECIRRWAELLEAHREVAGSDCTTRLSDGRKAPPQNQKGVASLIAEESGLSKSTVNRALNPVRVEAERNRSRIDADVKQRAAKEVAELLAEHIPGDWWDSLKANLYAAGAANIASELTNITGQSIMDRRYGS